MREQVWAPGSAGVSDYILRNQIPGLGADAKLVYLTLFSYMGSKFTCNPSVPTIAKGSALSERSVRYRLADLEKNGLITRTFPAGRPVAYHLYPPWDPCKVCTPAPLAGVQEVQRGVQEVQRGVQEVQGTPASGAAEVTQRRNPEKKPTTPPSGGGRPAKPATEPQFPPEAHELVNALWEFLQVREALPPTPKQRTSWRMSNLHYAKRALDPSTGKTLAEWRACLEWAGAQPFWASKVTTLSKLAAVWSEWKLQTGPAAQTRQPQKPKLGKNFDLPPSGNDEAFYKKLIKRYDE